MTSAVTADEFERPRELRQQVKEIGTNGASVHTVTPEPNPARPAEMMGEGKVASGPRRHRPARGGSGLTVGPDHAIGCIWGQMPGMCGFLAGDLGVGQRWARA